MDLLTTVRKEGSRGGRGDFKWSDVQSSTHRENYLGHSLMAPVGRWQKGRDLNWYAKGDADEEGGETAAEKAERERKEEIKRIKEVEQDALARALGYDVPPRNPNLESLGDRKEVDKILKEAAEDEDAEVGKGVGYGKFGINHGDADERILGSYESYVIRDAEVEVGADIVTAIDGDDIETKMITEDGPDRDHENAREDDAPGAEIGSTVNNANVEGTGVVLPATRIGMVGETTSTSVDDKGGFFLTTAAWLWRPMIPVSKHFY